MAFYPAKAPVPEEKRTSRLFLRPLRATDAELDYDAVMSSTEQLRRWSQRTWPADDFTLAENLADLERHEREHVGREAFTFTVMNPDASRCLGCVYVTPLRHETERLFLGVPHAADVGFWVRASEVPNELDRHLLATLREWFAAEWPFDRVVYTICRQETRQAALLSEAGLERSADFTLEDGRRCLAFSEAQATRRPRLAGE
jgi:RimJ/RimL family protein N-acetyltransferase